MRLLAIGDIHGCLTALDTLLDEVRPTMDDTLVTLGDYVDRGPDSKGVMDRLLKLETATNLIPLLGNHDLLFLNHKDDFQPGFSGWLGVGGYETIESYGSLAKVPVSHRAFLKTRCFLWHDPTDAPVFFVHGCVQHDLPLAAQTEEWLLWHRVQELEQPHQSGKTMICGHTAQRSGLPLTLPQAICIDTWACGEGWLTCYDVHAGTFTQANQAGQIRHLDFPRPSL